MNPSRIAIPVLVVDDRAVLRTDGAGLSRDGKSGCEQIEYGLLTDPRAPRARVRVFGPATPPTRPRSPEIVSVARDSSAWTSWCSSATAA